MNYPNLPIQSALNSNTLFTEQVGLSLKGIVRILEVLLSLDFFQKRQRD